MKKILLIVVVAILLGGITWAGDERCLKDDSYILCNTVRAGTGCVYCITDRKIVTNGVEYTMTITVPWHNVAQLVTGYPGWLDGMDTAYDGRADTDRDDR